jgi:hypothetical protein
VVVFAMEFSLLRRSGRDWRSGYEVDGVSVDAVRERRGSELKGTRADAGVDRGLLRGGVDTILSLNSSRSLRKRYGGSEISAYCAAQRISAMEAW